MSYKSIAETDNFIVLEEYTSYNSLHAAPTAYQTEQELEEELIADLVHQGYEYLPQVKTPEALLANLRVQVERLNGVTFAPAEWTRFLTEYLDAPSDGVVEKMRKVHTDYMYDFAFDTGEVKNIYLVDKRQMARNKVQVINQMTQKGKCENRYDVTLLVNGLPLVQIELKKRGTAMQEAFNQVHRYSMESFNGEHSLYKYLQLFVISNGTDTRYFANTLRRHSTSFDHTMHWAKANNERIRDLKDFTATFLQRRTLLEVLLTYSVFNTQQQLIVMRPYQIAATERILWKIKTAYHNKQWGTTEGGGYVWHTTGSGKTLTSFKTARLATELEFVDKVFFVVDRKDLDKQTKQEYEKFVPDSVNHSKSTRDLERILQERDRKIIVTTIQKLNNLMRQQSQLPVYQEQVVFIFDECHRSQFGEAQRNLRKKFKRYYQFGFTGTPIFEENAVGMETTEGVFGRQLHTYIITDAIRDDKVLKFKVDYNNVRPKFKAVEAAGEGEQVEATETAKLLLHPERIAEVTHYILTHYDKKTHRHVRKTEPFNAMFAVSSVEAAKLYYEAFARQQAGQEHRLRVATIFSYAANEAVQSVGELPEEGFDVGKLSGTSKAFLEGVIADYNGLYKTSFDVADFQNYYDDLSQRVKQGEVDLLIVVGMFLTGFDAPRLNTLFVDKNLSYHGLIQAFSRTNRLYDATKPFGNVVTFRDLEEATIKAIQLFGKEQTQQVVLERSYCDYMGGFSDATSGRTCRGYVAVVQDLCERFSMPMAIHTESDKKAFVKLFGEYLKIDNVLRNYDEYDTLKAFKQLPAGDAVAIATFGKAHGIEAEVLERMQQIVVLSERQAQDYLSTYNDIREWLRKRREEERKAHEAERPSDSAEDWHDVVFEVELLRELEINLDYILQLIVGYKQTMKDKASMIEEVRRMVRATMDLRQKEHLLVDFIKTTNIDTIDTTSAMMEAFYAYAQGRLREAVEALIAEENLNAEAAKRYVQLSLKRGYASDQGTGLSEVLPRMSPLSVAYRTQRPRVHAKMTALVETYVGVGEAFK